MGLPRERLAAPPRSVGPKLAAQMFLGGALSQIGWALFGFGSIFFWLFAWQADLSAFRFREDSTATVEGRVTGCSDTHYSVGGSRASRGTPVYENRYRYTVGSLSFEGASYDTGHCLGGGPVTIEYLRDRPTYSRIQGMRRSLLSPWALLAALFPAIGLVMVVIAMSGGWRRVLLLREGVPAGGVVKSADPTNTRVNGRTVYRVTLEFIAGDGRTYTAAVKTNRPELLQDDNEESVLYLPARPDVAVPIDSLPAALSLDATGGIVSVSTRAFLILPLASVALNWWLARIYW